MLCYAVLYYAYYVILFLIYKGLLPKKNPCRDAHSWKHIALYKCLCIVTKGTTLQRNVENNGAHLHAWCHFYFRLSLWQSIPNSGLIGSPVKHSASVSDLEVLLIRQVTSQKGNGNIQPLCRKLNESISKWAKADIFLDVKNSNFLCIALKGMSTLGSKRGQSTSDPQNSRKI